MLKTNKVYYTYNTNSNKKLPFIKIAGKWIEKVGFKIGDLVDISFDENIIVITKADKVFDEASILKDQLSK